MNFRLRSLPLALLAIGASVYLPAPPSHPAATPQPSPRAPADARSLQREYAVELLALLRKASGKSGNAIEVRAHLNESIALLDAALKAQVAKVIG